MKKIDIHHSYNSYYYKASVSFSPRLERCHMLHYSDRIEDIDMNSNKSDRNKRHKAAQDTSTANFVSVVSHDLKNPLSVIKAYTQMVKKRLLHKDDVQTVRLIEKKSNRLTEHSSYY
jgi:nitrogen-specific signal transduction histidine kinase